MTVYDDSDDDYLTISQMRTMVLEYLPTFTPYLCASFVGKSSSTMEHLGKMRPLIVIQRAGGGFLLICGHPFDS